MAQKQRASDIIGKALRYSNITSVKRRINFVEIDPNKESVDVGTRLDNKITNLTSEKLHYGQKEFAVNKAKEIEAALPTSANITLTEMTTVDPLEYHVNQNNNMIFHDNKDTLIDNTITQTLFTASELIESQTIDTLHSEIMPLPNNPTCYMTETSICPIYDETLLSICPIFDENSYNLSSQEQSDNHPVVETELTEQEPDEPMQQSSIINNLTSEEQSNKQDTPEPENIEHQSKDKIVLPSSIPNTENVPSFPNVASDLKEPLASTSSNEVLQPPPKLDSNGKTDLSPPKKKRKVKLNKQHFDYLSDEEDLTAIFGNDIESDTYAPSSDSSSSETSMTSKKKQKINKKRKNKKELSENIINTNEIGEVALKKKRQNKKKEQRRLKQSGQGYTKKDGTQAPAKEIKANPCIGKKCGNNCDSITNEKRKSIFDYFWSLSTTRRKDWLVSMTQKIPIKRKRSRDSGKRSYSYKYTITEGEGKRTVCLQFLAATLDVGIKFIQYAVHNSETGLSKEDTRGRCEPHNKTKECTIASVENFLKSLPAVPSHYCRKNSSRVYLSREFKNLLNLYQIYKKCHLEKGIDVVSERVFRSIFNERFNIGFHVPKKDKCIKCLKFDQNKDKPEIEEQRKQHEKEKIESYERFKVHQNIHKTDPSTLCASFDLQKVLNTPYGDSMLLFYSRKLAVYNFCVYESVTRKVYTFYWDEANGKRGANEIATILNKYIRIVDERGNIKNLLLYCDCCPGQNRNRIIMAMLHTTLQTLNNIETIQLNFLLTGHTYMPVDSVHAVIERNLKKNIIHAPSQWYTVFATARQDPEPYEVELLRYKDFNKWDVVGEKYFKGNLTGKISKMRVVTFKKNKESEITVKNSMNENANAYSIEVQPKSRSNPSACYKNQLHISKAKHDDLMKLCRDKVIPEIFHDEYNRLTTVNNIKDTLPESDIEDDDYSND